MTEPSYIIEKYNYLPSHDSINPWWQSWKFKLQGTLYVKHDFILKKFEAHKILRKKKMDTVQHVSNNSIYISVEYIFKFSLKVASALVSYT